MSWKQRNLMRKGDHPHFWRTGRFGEVECEIFYHIGEREVWGCRVRCNPPNTHYKADWGGGFGGEGGRVRLRATQHESSEMTEYFCGAFTVLTGAVEGEAPRGRTIRRGNIAYSAIYKSFDWLTSHPFTPTTQLKVQPAAHLAYLQKKKGRRTCLFMSTTNNRWKEKSMYKTIDSSISKFLTLTVSL